MPSTAVSNRRTKKQPRPDESRTTDSPRAPRRITVSNEGLVGKCGVAPKGEFQTNSGMIGY